MNDIYKSPQSVVSEPKSINLTFSSLGIWRKVFLVVIWLFLGLLVLSGIAVILTEEISPSGPSPIPTLILIALLIPYTIWIHVAIIRRKVTQLRIIFAFQIFPLMNPIGALIMWAIGTTSKKELETAV